MWQQRDVERRLWQYRGASAHNSTSRATLDDLLPLGGLGENLSARDVMSTETDLLCYRY
jgi:tyrosinase